MKVLQKIVCLGLLWSPLLAVADHHHQGEKQTRIMIHAEGELDSAKLAELMTQVHEDVGADVDGNVEVRVLVDDVGNVNVHKERVLNADNAEERMRRMTMPHAMPHALPHAMHGKMGMMLENEMSSAVAKCILKHLDKVKADAAAMLLHRACMTLERSEDNRDK